MSKLLQKLSPSRSCRKTVVDLPADTKIVKEGWLNKRGENFKNWRQRYFYLFENGSLIGFRGEQSNPRTAERLNNFTIKDCQIMITDKPKPYTFAIRGFQWTRVIQRTFFVGSAEELEDWRSAIEQVKKSLSENSTGNSSSCATFTDLLQEAARSSRSNDIRLLNANESGCTVNDQELFDKFAVRETLEDEHSGKKKVTFTNFEFLKVLGQGTFGKVVLCRDKETSKLYALKILKKQVIFKTEIDVEHALTENRVLQRTNHPFIMSLKCSFQSDDRLCFVTEFVNGGDLFFHLQRKEKFSENTTKFYAAEIISAIGYLHRNEIIYRDLKLENVLLDKTGHVKIADFGLCKEGMTYGKSTGTFCGSPEYLAPEVLDGLDYGLAVDWWGLGVAMYAMVFGRLPFENSDPQSLYKLIQDHEVEFPPETFISDDARDLLDCLLEKDPDLRLGGGRDDAQQVMDHPFFRSIDWDDLYNKKIHPPFIPQVTSDTDTSNFDTVFTVGASVQFTPPNPNEIMEYDPDADLDFDKFSYQGMSSTTRSFNSMSP